MGRPKGTKNIQTAEKLFELFKTYKEQVKSKPITVKDWVGKDAEQVHREKERPLTMEGFENYCYEAGEINDLKDYFCNKEGRYEDFAPICSRIRSIIRQDQIEGGMAGIYNPSITQRLNSLVDKQEIKLPKAGKDAEEEKYV